MAPPLSLAVKIAIVRKRLASVSGVSTVSKKPSGV